jgi:hypothetical protein
MMETIVSAVSIFGVVGVGAGLYYKLGRLEQKLEFLYENCDINITFKKKGSDEPKRVG